MSVVEEKSSPKGITRLQKFKKRVAEALNSLSCCIPWRRNKVTPIGEQQQALAREMEAAVKEPSMDERPAADVASQTSVETIIPELPREVVESSKDVAKDDIKSLTQSEDDVAELAVQLAIKASQSSALDDLL